MGQLSCTHDVHKIDLTSLPGSSKGPDGSPEVLIREAEALPPRSFLATT